MTSERRKVAGSRGGLGRIVAMALALAAGLLLALAGSARGDLALSGLEVDGGEGWHTANDFGVSWRNPSEFAVGGASLRITGYPGYRGGAQFVPGYGLSRIDHIRVPFAGVWECAVWVRSVAGWEAEWMAAAVVLRLDDVPPAVAFVPGDAQLPPPRLVAAVADAHSGVASGSIAYRRLDEERWTELPTEVLVGALGTELVAPTPQLRPGTTYLFRAEARDGAGNVATTALRADGSPMRFQVPGAPPAGPAVPPAGAPPAAPEPPAGAGARAQSERRRTRLLVGLAARRGRGRNSLTVGSGDRVLLRGVLSSAGQGLEGRPLRVVVRPARGGEGGPEVELLSTGADGRFQLPLPPGPSRRIAVAFAGAADLLPARRRLALRVRGAVSLRATPRRLATGGTLRLEGRVGSRGARVPRAGKLVTISYWEREARHWRPVIVTRTGRDGRFRASYRFRYVTGRARIRLRAEAPAEAQWPYAPGVSRPVTVEVHG